MDEQVVVIGSGVGGLSAAAQLARQGFKPLILERDDKPGGRFSTLEVDGFKVPTGAIAIETGGPFYELFEELDVDPDLRLPDPPVLIRVKGRNLKPGAPMWDHMIKRVTKTAGRVAEGIGKGRESEEEAGDMSLEEWAKRYTRSKTVLSLFHSLSAAIFTVNADELPAKAFFRHLRETGAFKRFGYAPRGNVEIAQGIADAIEQRGGEVRLGWTVQSIVVDDQGRATAVEAVDPDGGEHTIEAGAVFSNSGPINTAAMLRGSQYEDAFAERTKGVRPTSLMALAFTSDDELLDIPGLMNYTDTRRLCNIANLGKVCPELAPEGKTLYEAYGCPRPSVGGGYDIDVERRLLEEDLADVLPGYETAETVLFKDMAGTDAPAQHCCAGDDLPVATPIPNVFEVGDGVKPYGWIGTTACAQTGRNAVEAFLQGIES